jgi:hypothetical protein
MEKSQALGMVVGVGVLGSLATYFLLNSNKEDEKISTTETVDNNTSKNILEEIRKDTTTFLSGFWRETYNNDKKKIETSDKVDERETSSSDYN